jgi:hypothetical protein
MTMKIPAHLVWEEYFFFTSLAMMSDSSSGNADGPSDVWFEDLVPAPGLKVQKTFRPAEHNARTRRGLAIAILGILGALYAVGAAALLLGYFDGDGFAQYVSSFSVFQTLAAAAVGFYFAKGK